MKLKYLWIILMFVGLISCDKDDSGSNTIPVVELTSGTADLSNYVAVGASFTAGYTDGALFIAGQENSFPNILSRQFAQVDGGDFTQPLMSDNTGGFLLGGTQIAENRLVFNGKAPARLETVIGTVAPTTDLLVNNPTGPFKNMGVPGAKSFHLFAKGYGNVAGVAAGLANPYFARMASNPNASMMEDVMSQNPTFFTLSEIGGNDVLAYATSGGTGVDQTGNLDPTTYGSSDITDPNVFAKVFGTVVTTLTSKGAQGVVANVPYITDLPYFTTVPNNALVLDVATAAQLTGFFQAVAGIFTQVLIGQGMPPAQAQALAVQYAIKFNEGPNRFLIHVPVTPANPLGFRQMNEDELLLLTIDQDALAKGYGSVALTPEVLQVLGLLQQGGTPTPEQGALVIDAVNGIDDGDALDDDELLKIKTATDAYNVTIKTVADANGLALVDFKSILEEASTTGIPFDDFTMTTKLVTGGLVGLDGIHLTARGYALMANKFLEAIDTTYGSNFMKAGVVAKADDYPTNYSPTLQ